MRRSWWGHNCTFPALAIALVALAAFPAGAAIAGNAGEISGIAFKDLNRDGARQSDEPVLSGQQIYLLGADGAYLANDTTDASGRYGFAGLADGVYRVQYASPSWWELRGDWVASTTGAIFPRTTVTLAGSATANFGWRPIVRSRDLTAPISTYVGENGLRVESFNDVVPAREIYDSVTRGSVGPEAASVVIRFDYADAATTSASWQGSPGTFSSYRAICYDNWITWLEQGDVGVGHEYGHAWSLYNDTVVQQDGTLSAYLRARGLAGDSRLNTSYAWSTRELVAEDYRQLLGSPNARLAPQMNRDVPPAAAVPGLKEFLETAFPTAPASTATTPPPSATTVSLGTTSVAPAPVTQSGTVSSSLNVAANVSIEIRDSRGRRVRVLLSASPRAAGTLTANWDRNDDRGRRVKAGSYSAVVDASTSGGASAHSSTTFAVA